MVAGPAAQILVVHGQADHRADPPSPPRVSGRDRGARRRRRGAAQSGFRGAARRGFRCARVPARAAAPPRGGRGALALPAVAQQLGHPESTATMATTTGCSWSTSTRSPTRRSTTSRPCRRRCYGIHALLDAHFRKEEEIYLPLLEYETQADTVRFVEREMALHESGDDGRAPSAEIDARQGLPNEAERGREARVPHPLRRPGLEPTNSQPWLFHLDGDTLSPALRRPRGRCRRRPGRPGAADPAAARAWALRIAARHFGHD